MVLGHSSSAEGSFGGSRESSDDDAEVMAEGSKLPCEESGRGSCEVGTSNSDESSVLNVSGLFFEHAEPQTRYKDRMTIRDAESGMSAAKIADAPDPCVNFCAALAGRASANECARATNQCEMVFLLKFYKFLLNSENCFVKMYFRWTTQIEFPLGVHESGDVRGRWSLLLSVSPC